MQTQIPHILDIQVEETLWNDLKIDFEALFRKLFNSVCLKLDEKKRFELNILLTSDDRMQSLNAQFRGKDKPTNVLSFESGLRDEKMQPVYLGDLVFGYGIIHAEAAEENKSFIHHFTHLIIHGILHLFGHDHEDNDDAETMESLEIGILQTLDIPNPYL